jgi:putative ABC transport system permease protein
MKGLGFLIKFSYRNLWRAPKRTMIMLLSLTLGTGFIIWDLNFANSGSREVMKEFLSQYAGLYHVTHPEYYDPNNSKIFNNYRVIEDSLIKDSTALTQTTRRVTAPVFVSGEKKTLGVLLTGIEVENERRLSDLDRATNVGSFLSPSGSREIILGKKFAERISVVVGDEVVVIGQALDGSVANDLLKVVGLIDFGGGDLEESLAFTQIDTARELMAMNQEQYHQRVSFDMDQETLPVIPGMAVTKWTSLLPEISVSVQFIDRFSWLVCIIIVMVISLGLANTLMITFFEREQEFQSLNILGAKTSWVTLSLMIEVLIMGLISVIAGALLGHAMTLYCYYNPINLEVFTGGKPLLMGGMAIQPLIRLYPVLEYYWQVPLMIFFFLALTMIYPLLRVIRRSKNAL